MSRRNSFRFVLIATFIACVVGSARAQMVIYDWSVKGDAPKSYPTVTRRQAVTIRIENVNDILFSYRMRVTQRRFDLSDFDAISGLTITRMSPVGATDAAATCNNLNVTLQNRLDAATNAIRRDPKLPIDYATQTSHPSVPLKESLDAWRAHENGGISQVTDARNAIIEYNKPAHPCTILYEDEYEKFNNAVKQLRKKIRLESPHFIEESHTLDPASHVTVTVDEIYENETISTATFSFDTEDVLTLSAGAMFSRIQDRTYEARKDPTSELNRLTVTGNSRATPSLVALLNYSLGALNLDRENFGLALSAGPVLRVGGQADTSSFGFFTGISGHLYRRFFVTPGFHFGQFADFPVGFANGSSVPANFGELTPVKRWTARFGLAITFKTKSFDAFGSEKKIGGDEAGGEEPKPKEEKPENGDNASNSQMMDPPSALRAVRSRIPSRELAPTPVRSEVETDARESNSSPPTVPEAVSLAPPAPVYVSGSSVEPLTRIVSITVRSIAVAADERVSIETSARVSDYSMYFKAGRFYLVLPRTRLNVLQDGLQGQLFTDVVIEKRGSDHVLSFVLKPGTAARVVERATGLDLVFASSTVAQE